MTTPDVRAPYLLAVMGFGGFEQQVLDSYLGLARARTPAYAPCESIEDAHFVIANGDRGGVLDLLAAAQRTGDTVMVGQAQVAGVAATLARPIDPLLLFRALDEAVMRRSLAATVVRASPRNVTMAELSTPWSTEDQRGAAFYAPPGARESASPRPLRPLPEVTGPLGERSDRGSAGPDAKPRGERPMRRDAPAPHGQRLEWPGAQLLPSDPSIPRRPALGRRHTDDAGRADAAAQGQAPDARSTGRPPDGAAIPTLGLVSNEEPELATHGAAALRAPPARMPAARPAAVALAALVIDADPDELASLLGVQNVRATCVGKVHHAFAMLEAFTFDVILVGVDLGADSEFDGLQVCQAIRRQPRAPGEWCPPIVAVSAQPSALEQVRGMLAGANVYLPKPVRPAALAQALILAGLRPAWTPADLGGTTGAEAAGPSDFPRASH